MAFFLAVGSVICDAECLFVLDIRLCMAHIRDLRNSPPPSDPVASHHHVCSSYLMLHIHGLAHFFTLFVAWLHTGMLGETRMSFGYLWCICWSHSACCFLLLGTCMSSMWLATDCSLPLLLVRLTFCNRTE